MKWYARYPDAALTGMAEMRPAERGIYNSIIDALYSRDGDIPDDDRLIARIISVDIREWRTNKKKLIGRGKIWVENGKIYAKRVEAEIEKAVSRGVAKPSANGHQKPHLCENNNEINGKKNTSITTTITTEEKRESQVARKRALPIKSPLPENWFPPSEAFSPSDIPELEKMRDWARSNAILKADWPATWRNWKRRAPQFNGRNDSGRGRSVLAAADKIIDQLGGIEAARRYVPGSSGPAPLDLDHGPSPPGPRLISSR